MPLVFDDEVQRQAPRLVFDDEQPRDLFQEAGIPVESKGRDLFAEAGIPTGSQPKRKRTWGEAAGDTAIDLAKGVVGMGESVIGVADLVTGNMVGKGWSELGYDPERAKQMLSEGYSDARQQANRNVADAKGFLNKAGAMVDNPSAAVGFLVESAPMTLGGAAAVRGAATRMLAARGLVAGSAEAAAFLSSPAVVARLTAIGGAAEGAMTAGNIQEQGRQAGRDYMDTAPSAVAAGALTGIIGAATSKIPGFRDAEVGAALAGMGGTQRQGLITAGKEISKGAFKEGVLEEMPQSAQEQVFTNLALGKPWDEGVPEAAAQGMIAGAGMGGGLNTYTAGRNAIASTVARPAAAPSPVDAPAAPGTAATPGNQAATTVAVAAKPKAAVRPEIRLAELDITAQNRELTPEEQGEFVELVRAMDKTEANPADPFNQDQAPVFEDVPDFAPTVAPTPQEPTPPTEAPQVAESPKVAPKQNLTWFGFLKEKGISPATIKKNTQQWTNLKVEFEGRKAGVVASAESLLPPATPATRTTPVTPATPATPATPTTGPAVNPAVTPDALPPAASTGIQDLQNRDRSRAASVMQMANIASNPDYMRLGASRTPDSGAPMVFPVGDDDWKIPEANLGKQDIAVMADGQRVPFIYAVLDASQVEPSHFVDGRVNPVYGFKVNGTIKALNNGRVAGLRAAHEQGTTGNYVAELIKDAPVHGIPAEVIERTPNPILVRAYQDASNTPNMAAKSQGQGLGMSPGELARQDAPLMDATVLTVYRPGDVSSAANRDFVRAFVGKLVQSGQDVAGMMTAQGTLSPAGRTRIQAAMVQAAYGDADLVQEMFESQDNDIKSIGEALKTMSGPWADMRDSARTGAIDAQADVTDNLLQAVNLVRKSRQDRTSLYDLVQQTDMMTGQAPDDMTRAMLRMFYGGTYLTTPYGRDKVIAKLNAYTQAAMNSMQQADMFGERVTVAQILETLTQGDLNDNTTKPQDSKPGAAGVGDIGRAADDRGAQGPGQRDGEGRARPGDEGTGQRPAGRGEVQEGGVQADPGAQADGLMNEQAPNAKQGKKAPADFWSFAKSKGFAPGQIKVGTPEHAALKAEFDAMKAGKPTATSEPQANQDDYGQRWDRMTTTEREAVALNSGLKKVPAANLAKRWWKGLDPVVQDQMKRGMPEQRAPGLNVKTATDSPRPATKIEDAGEKIGGARKDRWKDRGLNLDDLDSMSESEGAELAIKANVWKPDYEALAEAAEPVTAAMVKTVYDQLAAKPKDNTPEGRRLYVQMMQIVRDVYTNAKSLIEVDQAYLVIRQRAGLNTDDPQAKAAARKLLFTVYKGRSDPFVLGYNEKAKAKKLVEDGFPAKGEPWKNRLKVTTRQGGEGTTERGVALYTEGSAEVGTPLTREQIMAGFYRVQDKKGNTLAYAATKEDAEAAAKTIYERDIKGSKDDKAEPTRPHLDILKRENLPQRIERDAVAKDFVKTFGFRGIEFGNWAAQDERQRIINMAYDGLMDLAEIMGVPPKAMSLNGTLGMAFGARGGGKFAAHYEPGKLVINMTKLQGGGSMAHEWAHALDHYFGELNQKDAYTTKARGASGWYEEGQYKGMPQTRHELVDGKWKAVERMRLENLRPEMARAFDEVMQALFQKQVTKAEMVRSHELDLERTEALAQQEQDPKLKDMYQRMATSKRQFLEELRQDPEDKMYAGRGRTDYANNAQALSGKSVNGYWVRPTEMFARAFESWVFDRVTAMGARSDYLVHGVEQDRFAGGNYKGNPYPTGEERARINAAFTKLAQTIQTKETDQGVAMFTRGAGAKRAASITVTEAQSIVRAIQSRWDNAPDVVVVSDMQDAKVPQSVRDYDAEQRSQGASGEPEGFWHKGKVYIVAGTLSRPGDVIRVMFHETLGHYGLRGVFGQALNPILEQIIMARRPEVAAKAKQYGLDMAKPEDALTAAEEVLATMAQEKPELGFVKRAIAAVRTWLRANVPGFADLKLTDAEIINSYILPARVFVQGRKDGAAAGTVQVPAFSRNSLGATPPEAVGLAQVNAWTAVKSRVMRLTSPETIDKLIYEFQNKYIDLKRIQDHIKALDGTVTDLNDAYLGEELFHKRLAKRTEDFLKTELKPLLARLKASGIEMQEFETYLHARHAPEANAAMAKRNPNQAELDAIKDKLSKTVKELELKLQSAKAKGTATKALEDALSQAKEEARDWFGAQAFKGTEEQRLSLSGMSDQEAAAIMNSLTPQRRKAMQELAAMVDAINAKTLDTLQSYGLMDAATLNSWRKAYEFYVPLHRDEAKADGSSHPVGAGFSVKGSAAKQRTGSTHKVSHILGHIAMQREAALTRGEKNHVAKKVFLLAAQNPNEDVWTVDKPPMLRTIDPNTGIVRSGVDPLYKSRPNVLMVRLAGKDVSVVFNKDNPQAMRMVESMKNLDIGDLHVVLGLASKGTRWFASVNTQYNPIFGMINFARDLQDGMLNLSTTPLAGKQLDVAKGVPAAMRAIYRQARGKGAVSAETQKWIKLWDEMQLTGGATGYRDLYANAEERVKSLERELKALDRGEVSQAAHAVVNWLSDYNEAMENAVRLSAYKVARDSGISKDRAASLSKNLTVNFNRKGRQTREIGALYAFFNAAIQGTVRMAETLKGPIGKRIMLGGVALGVINSLVGMAVMGGSGEGDDDQDEWSKIPEFIKENSLIIPLGRKDYLTVPLPLGYKVFPNIGRLAMEFALGGSDKTAGKTLGKLITVLMDAFNPLGGTQNLGQMVAPTVLDPVVALMQNRDWTGRPIYRENNNPLNPQPGTMTVKDSASSVGKGLAAAINTITGGTPYRPGAWSPTPDQIDYLFGQLTGGLGRELLKVNQVLTAPFTGDELPPHKIPLIGRLYGNTSGPSAQAEQFYENVKVLNEIENELKGRMRNNGDVDAFRASEPLVDLVGMGSGVESQISTIRRNRRAIVERAEPGYQAQVKEIDKRIGELMAMLNQEVTKARKAKQNR